MKPEPLFTKGQIRDMIESGDDELVEFEDANFMNYDELIKRWEKL
jgi:hypothetical protein|tara:strand:+ start:246 stop:380 length:135 start_codon:yes stop_codon:yes gene_type:complete